MVSSHYIETEDITIPHELRGHRVAAEQDSVCPSALPAEVEPCCRWLLFFQYTVVLIRNANARLAAPMEPKMIMILELFAAIKVLIADVV